MIIIIIIINENINKINKIIIFFGNKIKVFINKLIININNLLIL